MFRDIQGNARYCLMYEPLFFIPFNLFLIYAPVYMLELGLSKTQIGLITSINLVFQIFTSFISGYVTDRLGRKKALVLFDMLGWCSATLVWAISQNFWFFLLAATLNSFGKAAGTPWNCLLVEETDQKVRPKVFTILQFMALLGGLFAPLGGLLVSQWGLVPAVRGMYFLAFISMTTMVILRNRKLVDTKISIQKQMESRDLTLLTSLRTYLGVLRQMLVQPILLLVCGMYILFHFQMNMRNTYFSVYIVDALGIDDRFLSIIPAVASAASILLLLFVIPRFKPRGGPLYMVIGFGLSIISYIMLVVTPYENIPIVIWSTILYTIGTIIAVPYLEAALANVIKDEDRANVVSILAVFMLIFISPSGIIGGWTYVIDSRIPFVIMATAFVVSIGLLIGYVLLGRKMGVLQVQASEEK